MAKAGRRKRRQAAAETARGNARAEEYGARLAARSAARRRPPTWADRVSPWGWFGLCAGGLVGALFAQFALWQWVIPPVGDVVGRVPVLSTVVGWLFAGGAFVAVGVAVVNDKIAREVTRRRLRLIAYVWGGLAVLCLPIGWAEGVTLPTDYWAGVFAGAYGVAASPLASLVVAFVWWLVSLVVKPARAAKDGPAGWAFIGYGVLLLVWGSTLLRM